MSFGAISRIVEIRVASLRLDAALPLEEFVGRAEEVPGVASLVRLPLGVQQLSVRDDDVGRRFGRLDAVGAALVLELAGLLARGHLDLRLGFKLGVLLVAEGAEGRRRRVGVHAVVGRAVAGAVAGGGEEALPGLAGAVAHLGHGLVVHLDTATN